MRTNELRRLAAILAGLLLLCCTALAETRTTPVEVQNTPTFKLDATANTVKATQSGTWSLGLDPLANLVKFDPTGNTVKSEQSGAWTVRIDAFTNTVNALSAQLGTWTVGLNSAANTVKTPTQSQTTYLLSSDYLLTPMESWTVGSHVNCSGYKEVRLVLGTQATEAQLREVELAFYFNATPVGDAYFYADGYSSGITAHPGFRMRYNMFVITLPVMGDDFYVRATNGSSVNVRFQEEYCRVYLVN